MENGIRPPIQMAVDSMRSLCLGYAGEQNAQLIQIDVSKWQEKWPGASIDLMLALPGEKVSYPAKTELQDGKLLFLPGYGDTQKPGHGAAYVVATKDGTHLAASDTVLTEIMHKGRGGDELPEAPEAQAGWVANVLDAAHRAEEAAKRAENAGGGTITDEQVGKAVEDYLQENPIEVPVQSVNGKTGAVQLSAADVGALPKDTPIPAPYTLPTASPDTLGGVKVGKGLQMDGDVMSVVEKPDAPFKTYKTITLEKETLVIEEDIPECKECIVTGLVPKGSAADSGYVLISKNGTGVGALGAGSVISASVPVGFRAHVYQGGGAWIPIFYRANQGEGAATYGPVNPPNIAKTSDIPYVNRVKIYCFKTGFPVGSIFTIYIPEVQDA